MNRTETGKNRKKEAVSKKRKKRLRLKDVFLSEKEFKELRRKIDL